MQDNYESLEILEALYEIYTKYSHDKYITERIGKISQRLWTLTDAADLNFEVFFDLAEGAGDNTLHDHYKSEIEHNLEELNKLRKYSAEEQKRQRTILEASDKAFSKEGYRVEAYYSCISGAKILKSASVFIARDSTTKALTINTGVEELRSAIHEALDGIAQSVSPTQDNMQLLANALPHAIGEYKLQSQRVANSADWVTKRKNITDL